MARDVVRSGQSSVASTDSGVDEGAGPEHDHRREVAADLSENEAVYDLGSVVQIKVVQAVEVAQRDTKALRVPHDRIRDALQFLVTLLDVHVRSCSNSARRLLHEILASRNARSKFETSGPSRYVPVFLLQGVCIHSHRLGRRKP